MDKKIVLVFVAGVVVAIVFAQQIQRVPLVNRLPKV